MPRKRTDKTSKKSPKDAGKETSSSGGGMSVEESHLPVVGIGASAGGLEAFEHFFTHIPGDTGIAFVLIQHLDPTHKSILTELVRRYTPMDVMQVEDGMPLKPNTVFVIPPNRYMAIFNGNLHLMEPTELPGLRTPIDFFFRSLAEDQKERAICIVLSGTGTEGALGLRAVKGEGGMAMVQDPDTAKYDGMPRSAIATGLADFILPPQRMPEQLIAYVDHALFKRPAISAKPILKNSELLDKVFMLLRTRSGHDFSNYKHNTILRRIDRRMAVHQIGKMSDYVRYIQDDPRELDILFKELLIGVTNFFRDKEAFDILKNKVIKKLFERQSRDRIIRIWVPGCATGEESYSIAMLCYDVMSNMKANFNVQIFATDIDNGAIETARQGLYPSSISADVSPEYLERYFNKEESFHKVKKEIRDMVVFALQNVIADPPFSKIDLISCRNLLIYLGAELQKKVLPMFHYALRKDGFLFLGSSESVGEFSELFSVEDRKWKIFRRKEVDSFERPAFNVMSHLSPGSRDDAMSSELMATKGKPNLRHLVEAIILGEYGPTAVIINEKNDILYIHGKAGKYLEPPVGEFSGDILAMARPGLKLELATSIRKASVQKMSIRSEGLSVKTNGGNQEINLVVKPLLEPPSMEKSLLVIFEDIPPENAVQASVKPQGANKSEEHPRVQHLEQELRSTKEYLQTTIEELETANEELKSTNEELQSSNEELQSTNEELETSKEELQSVNEELTTVNAEHQQKIDELSKATSDLNNLLASTEVGTIFLDIHLNIQRFTPAVTEFINLIHSDIGRPVSHIVSNIDYDGLVDDAKEVLRKLTSKECEVRTKNGRWYQMRILPYRTIENVIDGVVVTFSDITTLKEALDALKEAREKEAGEEALKRKYWQAVADTTREAILVLDANLTVESVNRAFCKLFKTSKEEIQGMPFFDICEGCWDHSSLRNIIERIWPDQLTIKDHLVEGEFPNIGNRMIMVNASRMDTGGALPAKIVLAFQDITEIATRFKECPPDEKP